MGVGRHVTAGMADQQQVAEAADLIARIGDHAVLGGVDRRAARRRDSSAGEAPDDGLVLFGTDW